MNFDGERPVMGAVPGLGEHTAAVMRELGFHPSHPPEGQLSGAT
jgi:hypothetical protein